VRQASEGARLGCSTDALVLSSRSTVSQDFVKTLLQRCFGQELASLQAGQIIGRGVVVVRPEGAVDGIGMVM
jgi:hypothetical protein